MQISLSTANILKTQFENLLYDSSLTELLSKCNLYDFENLLHQKIFDLYDKICEALLCLVGYSPDFVSRQKIQAENEGLKKLEFRDTNVRLRTGTKVVFPSLYAKVTPKNYNGSRLLSSALWDITMNCSPAYKSLNCLHSILCPSFDVSKELLNYQNIHANFEKVRQSSLDLADDCISERSTIQLEKGESLSGKRVVIAMDGGRSRTRVYEEGKSGRDEKFATPWREPKMFVISTIDEEGKPSKESKPIYDTTFGDDETFELLGAYLKELEIEKAESVQFLADGAVWIWNRVKPILMSLGLAEDKIIETLDYYHAIEHVNEMKVYFDKDKLITHFAPLKDALW